MIIQFPGRHHEHTPNGDKCLSCEIFALIARDFPDIETTEILNHLVECLANIVCVSAKTDKEEAFAESVGEDIVHVTRQFKLFRMSHRLDQ